MEEDFDILAAKVLADEASPEERAQLGEILARNAGLRQEFAEMKSMWNSLAGISPLVQALDAPPAPIPLERLVQLQEVVRKKFGHSAPPARERVSASSGQRSPIPDPSHSRNAAPEQMAEDASVFAALRQWLMDVSGRPRFVVSFMLLLIGLIAAGILFSDRSSIQNSSDPANAEIAAYLVLDQGESEARRAGQQLTLGVTTPLHAPDEVRLAAGAKAYLVTASGVVELAGPKRFKVAEEVASGQAGSVKTQSTISQRGSANKMDALRTALFLPVREILSSTLMVTTRRSQSIPLYSPAGSTASLTPLIIWKSEPGKTYDLTITDEFDPKAKPLRIGGVVPPVEFSMVEAWKGRSLAKDGLYRITLSETGKPLSASEYTFRTVGAADGPRPSAPVERLLRAFQILKAEPSRVGDAFAELLALPEEFAGSEMALRLKLLAFGQLGYQEDFDAVGEKLRSIDATR